jgi:hypothetical protein
MAKKTSAPAPAAADPTPADLDVDSGTRTGSVEAPPPDTAPRPPQGIVVRFMNTGNRKKDLHPYFAHVALIDAESLRVDGQNPFLALPIPGKPGEPRKYRVRPVEATAAAELLSCDKATGAEPTCRLATDAEVEQYHREMEARRRK